ncbi:SDR family NAD(P)-dependent oxidoreductase [Amycolatopsis pithecellobii]|uniref:SDR family NAD(P)-dependent oxidoreductase n=1 Tax=Amycolatopsis pithecellobii TaxID=664692 RepID=A0A6N7Z1S3_9PSEU|nr:SDR family NAD(P)-dependent oxidoreductase [Amycolatopsis pithecellobii]MTD53841.1 SDR family NAD(P)-dependent oxidoreductase [Amycolatopsis pithecellobii]
MDLNGATALVTGTNRGLGHHFAVELLKRGAKVYATARRPELVDLPGAEVLRVDITDQESVAAAAAAAPDVDLLINNAAFTGGGNFIGGDLDSIRAVMDSSYYGTLAMIRAFAPVLARNGGGAILNVLSTVAWMTVDGNTSYAAAKSAQWGLTNGVRVELAGQNTLVCALVPGLIDTETLREYARGSGIVLPEQRLNDPAELARRALDGIAAGEIEILDESAVEAKARLAGPPAQFDLSAAGASAAR